MLREKHNGTPDTTGITIDIYLLRMLIIVSKYLVLIVSALVGISAVLTAYDFMTGNTGWGIVNAVLAFGGIMLLVQLKQNV